MASFNKVILIGHLTADPELKQTQSGISVVSFSIGVNRKTAKDAEPKTDFINITAWRQTAEFVARYFKKGKPILVCGSLQCRSYTDSQGNKRYATEVVADEASFVESRQASDERAVQPDSTYVPDAYTQPKFEDVSEQDGLPF